MTMTHRTPSDEDVAKALRLGDCTTPDGTYVHCSTRRVVEVIQGLLRTCGETSRENEK